MLVNNAGVHLDLRSAWHEPHLVDGMEVHWRTNYLGTAQLTRLLVPLLLATADAHGEARVVNVVSKLHARGRNDGLDGHLTPYDSWTAYGTSKLALVHEAREIERRYGERGLHGYSVHPGSVHTKIADRGLETAPMLGRLRKLAAPLERRALRSPADGARTVVFCATSPQAEPGGYHRSSAPSTPSDDAQDEEAGRILWDNTSRWVRARLSHHAARARRAGWRPTGNSGNSRRVPVPTSPARQDGHHEQGRARRDRGLLRLLAVHRPARAGRLHPVHR